jgi:ABC-type Mn2+/Zn2+ transport system permease subunit
VLAVAAVLGGFYVAPLFHVETGPFTIAVAAAFFFLSLAKRRSA